MNPSSPSNPRSEQTPTPNAPQSPGKIVHTPPAPTPQKKLGFWLPISIGLCVLMLMGVAWLTYTSISTTRALQQRIVELEEAEKLQAELESQYFGALTQLDELRGQSQEINQLIDQQKAELEARRLKINTMLRDKSRLDAARSEIADLKTRVTAYLSEIELLTMEQQQLKEQNAQLQEENVQLAVNLDRQTTGNLAIAQYQTKLVNEKEELAKAVRIGSVVRVKDIRVTGEKVNKNGRVAVRQSARKIDRLKVCFTTLENDIVEPGNEKFFIRIINPKGETLAIDDLGAGVLENSAGEQIRYSQVQEYKYANEETPLCFTWQPGILLPNGIYEVEIYNKGYLAGKGTFELK